MANHNDICPHGKHRGIVLCHECIQESRTKPVGLLRRVLALLGIRRP